MLQAYKLKKTKGYFWSKNECAYIENGNSDSLLNTKKEAVSKLNKFNTIGILIRVIIGHLMNLLYFVIVYTAVLADVSLSIIISILALTPFTSAVAFYFVFGEGLHKNHFLGMVFMTICVFVLTNSTTPTSDSNDEVEN